MQGAWIAAAIGLMALIVVLPIPLGNLLPLLAMMLIGLAFVMLMKIFGAGTAVVLSARNWNCNKNGPVSRAEFVSSFCPIELSVNA